MISKLAVLTLAAAVLSGCVLQSRAPIYGDRQASLALGSKDGVAKMSEWENGKWVDSGHGPVEIAVVGKHYVAKSKTDVALHFVKLKGNWFVVQGVESGSVLACKDLKANAATERWIDYQGDDCFVKRGTKAKELFTALLENPGAPSFRMEIIH
jgi:hypothetical protein